MDKNKNRTDLLAAGRKRLQQFRQKKDNKGSTSQGESSKKSGKSKRRESDDSDVGSAVDNPKKISQASEESFSEHVSCPIEDSYSLESNVANPLPDMYEVRNIESSLENLKSHEDNVASLTPTIEENLSTADVEVVEVASSEDPKFTVSEGDMMLTDVPDASIPPISTDATEKGVGNSEIDSMIKKENLWHLSEDLSDVSSVAARAVQVADVGAMQEADGLGSKQVNNNDEKEHDGDSRLSSEQGESAEIIDSLTLKGHGLDETTTETKQLGEQDNLSSGVVSSLDGIPPSSSQSDTYGKDAVTFEATKEQKDDSAVGSSTEETSDMLSESGDCIRSKDLVISENAVVAELHNMEDVPHSSTDPENKTNDKSQNSNMTTHIGFSEPGSSRLDHNSVSFSKLSELILGLGDDEYRFLISLRNSKFPTAENNISTEYGHFDALERLKEELVFSNSMKRISDMQFTEQSDELEKAFDHQRLELIDEISLLNTSLHEVREENGYLSKELMQNKSELEAVSSGRDDLQYQLNSARAEIEELSGRVHDLQAVLEKYQEDLSAMSTELVDCKNIVATLQSENETANRTLLSVIDERENLEKEKEDWLQENENLSTKLAESEKMVALMQLDLSNINDLLVSERNGRKAVEEEKENLAREIEKALTELAEHKGIVTDLRMENDSLVGIVSIVTEEKRKLEEEVEQIVHENDRLSSELLILQDQLSKVIGERMEFEINLENSMMCLEQLIEQTILLNISLDAHKAELREIDSWQSQMPPQGSVAVSQVGYVGMQKGVHEVAIEDHISNKISSLDEPLSDKLKKSPKPELHEQKLFNDSGQFVVLEGHLQEAEEILQKLDNEVDSMRAQLASENRQGGKAASSGVSKLIQAFESNVTADEDEQRAQSEDTLPKDPCAFIKEQIGRLTSILKQLMMDAENAGILFRGELEAKKTVADAARELSSRYEDLQEHGCTLEATNVELGVLYEAMKHHLFDVEHKNNELLVLCENLKCQDISQKAENSELVVQLDVSQLKISDLEVKLHELQQISEEKNSLISRQLEVSRKEAADHALQLEKEWSSTISQLDGTIQKFDKSIGGLFPLAVTFTSSDPNDVVGRVTASIHVAFKVIEDMLEKLQAAHVVEVVLRHSYEELAARFNILHVKNAANVIVLQRLHGELKALVNDSSGSAEDGEMEMQNDQLLDPADLYYFETLMNQLKSSLDEKLQLFSVNDHLRSEVKELTDKSFDVNALHDLVEDVVAVIKPEGTVFESDDPPIVRLKSLMILLVHNYTEADEKLKRECESEFLELTKMQEKIEDFSTMQIQQESEILVLKESLRQAEESLAASSSELREKSTELEQSEQRVSSLREKLSIAVAKGKGLVVQRDSLKQSLAETSSELESCSGELKLKAARLSDVEEKLKAYSEAGERVEALESELSYIRNSATALRESFLLKDSVIQRIEEILEELDLPENFHSRGILEKIDWLARSAMGNSVPLADWDQKGSVEGGSYSDVGFTASDAWREDGQPGSNSGDDFRRRFEDVQGKFYGLAEQNEMLEQSLMERNNLVQRWEELLDRINMPPQLRSMDPVDRIEWLGAALSEAYHGRTTLQEKIDKLESYCELMTSDLDESKRQRADLEAELKEIGQGREKLKERLTILIGDREKLSAMVVHLEVEKVTLEDEVNDLQDRLAEKIDVEKNMLVVKHDIRRFQDMVVDALHDPGLKSTTYNNGSTEGLEERLTKLIESYKALLSAQPASSDEVDRKLSERDVSTFHTVETKDALDSEELDIVGLKKELEEALRELKDVKEERDSYLEKQQSLISEVEAMNSRITELQALLGQEEQKSASVREKLNVAVRKGKSLVQQRDGLKQTIEDLNNEVERLKSDLNSHVNAIADYEQKMKILSSYQDRLEAVEAENSFLRNHLAEAEQYLQEKDNRLNTLLQTLDNIDTGKEIDLIDPVKKLEQMGTLCHELHTSLAHSEQEVMKSKRAADLLLAELNEVQERNDGLQEDLDKAANELEVLSRGRNEAEASKLEALSRLEKLSTAHIEERKNLFAQIMQFKSDIEQLNNGLYDIHNQLPCFFSKNLEFMRNMKVRLESFYEPSLITGVFNLPIIGSLEGFSSDKENFQSVDSWSISHEQDIYDDNFMVEMCSYVARHIKDIMSDVASLKENLRTFSLSLHEHANSMSETMSVVQSKVNSQRESFEAMKKSITHLESNLKEKDSEVDILQRNMSLLYEACASSISEIENRKAAILGNNVDAQDVGVATNVESSAGLDFSRHTNMMPVVENMAGRFRNVVKEFACMNAKTLEGSQKDMKTTIANLQKELQEKDIQKDRICIELVGQIKEAEAAAHRHLVDLQSSESHLSELQEHLRVMEVERNVLKQNVNELQDEQASSKELQEKVELLTEAVNAKDQEIESLMQALDEEEAQMEDLKSKVQYLEKVLQQKDLDLDNLESSRAKVMKKLSVTVARFDELHQLSGNLLTEVENLQSQLQEKDAEISFLRQEVTRCTNDVLIASQMSSKSSTDEIQEFLTWLDNRISGVMEHDVQADDVQSHELKERLKKKIMSILSELVDLRVVIQSKDALLQVERSRVEELTCKKEMLEKSLHENESQLGLLDDAGDSGPTISATSQIVEAESVINKWTVPATSSARQVRSLRKANNEQVAIAIDTDADSSNQLADEDDEKVHGFKSLTRSRIVPRFTRPITDMVDGLWVSCDRALMRHPTLRLGIIIYWAILHALLGTFVV